MTQCTAKSKRTGQRCGAQAVTGRNVCYHHGGKTRQGVSSGTWKDGTHSKYLPKRMLDDYQASLDDPNKLALDNEIALIDSRLKDLLRRVDVGESAHAWKQLRETVREYDAARLAGDATGTALAVNTLMDQVRKGGGDIAAWNEIMGLVERRRRLVESERKRLVQAQQLIASAEVLGLLHVIALAVKQHVRDPKAVAAVTAEIARVIGPGVSGYAGAETTDT